MDPTSPGQNERCFAFMEPANQVSWQRITISIQHDESLKGHFAML